jgi:trans-2,3-dihydro-3-hydroxyanthranilate isomerase
MVDSCVRADRGGSPTAVVDDDPDDTDADRQTIAALAPASHTAFLHPAPGSNASPAVRFFTRAGELAGCGHGTVAAQAVLLSRSGQDSFDGTQFTGSRMLSVNSTRLADSVEVWLDQGPVTLAPPAEDDLLRVLDALGIVAGQLNPADSPVIASPGARRLLVPIASDRAISDVSPDPERLASECRRAGLLGCFVYAPPEPPPPAVTIRARMFAPAIGVAEDVANANSTGCVAAHLLATHGTPAISCDQGDAVERPSRVFATATATASGYATRVGGVAIIRETFALPY